MGRFLRTMVNGFKSLLLHKLRSSLAMLGILIGVTAVICAVFVPIAFLGGVVGTLYKQFAITITISTLLSALTALTLTPALCALILKPGMHKPRPILAFDRFFEDFFDFPQAARQPRQLKRTSVGSGFNQNWDASFA